MASDFFIHYTNNDNVVLTINRLLPRTISAYLQSTWHTFFSSRLLKILSSGNSQNICIFIILLCSSSPTPVVTATRSSRHCRHAVSSVCCYSATEPGAAFGCGDGCHCECWRTHEPLCRDVLFGLFYIMLPCTWMKIHPWADQILFSDVSETENVPNEWQSTLRYLSSNVILRWLSSRSDVDSHRKMSLIGGSGIDYFFFPEKGLPLTESGKRKLQSVSRPSVMDQFIGVHRCEQSIRFLQIYLPVPRRRTF